MKQGIAKSGEWIPFANGREPYSLPMGRYDAFVETGKDVRATLRMELRKEAGRWCGLGGALLTDLDKIEQVRWLGEL